MLPDHDKSLAMADAVLNDMQRIARLAAEPRAPGDSTKAAIGRAARALGLSYRRARSFWYASPDAAVRAWEADRVRAEERNILASRRWRLEQEILMIEARLNARESGANGSVVGQEGRSVLPVAGPCVDEQSEAVREAGLIPDPRQMALGRGW